MDVGAVVGVLLAYKDLPSPIKELIDWDQQRQDVQIKYEQVIDQFQPEGMMPEELQAIPDGPPPPLGHELALAGVTVSEDGRVKQLDSVSLILPTCTQARGDRRLELGQGRAGPGAGAAGAADRRLDQARRQGLLPAARIRAGRAHRLCRPGDLPVPAVGARQPAVRPEASGRSRRRPTTMPRRRCARRSGRKPSAPAIRRSIPTPTGSTTSWPAPPVRPTCCRCMVEALKQVELDEDIYSLGLRGTIDAGAAARPRREDPEGAPRAAWPPAGSELCRPGRDRSTPTATTATCRSPRTCCSARRSARTSTATTSRPTPTCSRC